MRNTLAIITVISSIMIIIAILLQNQGSGLGTAFGGESNFYRTKRGAEQVLFYFTIVLAVVFVGSLIGLLLVK
ncbi:MAG TPA: preprotein translocase subunit SecG [Candidatus Saccharibacteria bacterium]|nr:preprotein translocase subunit SecG [Candidatus Saccharibacteria bacterium]HMT39852.1 preprotein translocase subunit SecG [Candidatus Saccharibacteria bacterium]